MSCLGDVVVPPVNDTVADVEDSDKALWDKLWIGFGIFLGLLGSVLINLGNNLQALAMHRSGTLKAKSRWAAVQERVNAVIALSPEGQPESRTEAVAAKAAPVYSDETLAALTRWTRIKIAGTTIFRVRPQPLLARRRGERVGASRCIPHRLDGDQAGPWCVGSVLIVDLREG